MNTRKTVLATLLAALAAAPLAVTPMAAQAQAPAAPQFAPQFAHTYTQAELDQMLAPIALYPDALLSQVLMAATYPIEVVEAARWSRANPGLRGDDAVRAVQNEDWDPSVKSLVAFPEILQRMDEKLEWTRALGDAFLAQEPQLMDQVQRLRQRAETNGNLRSDEQIRVVHEGPVIVVRPARPEYVYVPYYDPQEVYGTWWWPDYRPVYWAPWPGYARPRPSYAFWWGRPTGVSLNFFFGDFDWGRRHVRVAHNSYYYRQPAFVSRGFTAERTRWQHDPHHRREVAYRSNEVRQRFATAQIERRETVREERRDERQLERRTDRRDDRQAARQQPAAALQAAPQTVTPAPRAERREDRRDERRAERQAAPAQAVAQPRAEQRDGGRAQRQAAMEAQRQARQQAQDSQRQAQQQQARQQAQAQRQAQQQARQAERATMPAAQAPQQPRAERQERREERREQRQEHRKDRDKG